MLINYEFTMCDFTRLVRYIYKTNISLFILDNNLGNAILGFSVLLVIINTANPRIALSSHIPSISRSLNAFSRKHSTADVYNMQI